jgi:hypothetical protein
VIWRAAVTRPAQVLSLRQNRRMDNTQALDDLAAVMIDAGARSCGQCGQQTAVRTLVSDAAFDGQSLRTGAVGDSFAWFCFECGHEERVEH